MSNRLTFLGWPTIDLKPETSKIRKGKQVLPIGSEIGGQPVNSRRAISCFDINAKLVIFGGVGPIARAIDESLRDEFEEYPLIIRTSRPGRVSIVEKNKTRTTRPVTGLDELPVDAKMCLKKSGFVIVGPLMPADKKVALDSLAQNGRSILILSNEQLRERTLAYELASKCSILVSNDSEAFAITDEKDPIAAIMKIHDRCGCNVVITGEQEINARFDDNWYCQHCFDVNVVQTSGAGDTFVATLAACLIYESMTFEQALRMAAAAAGRHVSGLKPCSLNQLKEWADNNVESKPRIRKPGRVVAAGLAAAASLIWALFSFSIFVNH